MGWVASAVREGEAYMTDVQSMVDNVIAATRLYLRVCTPGQAEYELISRLNIIDHGNPDGIYIGDDYISMQNIEEFAPNLGRLRGHFEKNGFVHLQQCDVGQNLPLLQRMANIWQARVYAGTGAHNPVYRFNTGDYVYCDSGEVNQQVCKIGASRP
jgi:hypothetical protein